MAREKERQRRALWFDREDRERIKRDVFAHFLTVPFKQPPPLWATHLYFHPYPKDPETMILIKEKKKGKMNLDHAKNCLEYLGFDETFRDNFLRLYKEDPDGELGSAAGVVGEHAAFAVWWHFLVTLPGEDLKRILTPDDASQKKWKHRLRGRRWHSVSMFGAHGAMADITKQLFEDVHSYTFTTDALERKITRWKKDRKIK